MTGDLRAEDGSLHSAKQDWPVSESAGSGRSGGGGGIMQYGEWPAGDSVGAEQPLLAHAPPPPSPAGGRGDGGLSEPLGLTRADAHEARRRFFGVSGGGAPGEGARIAGQGAQFSDEARPEAGSRCSGDSADFSAPPSFDFAVAAAAAAAAAAEAEAAFSVPKTISKSAQSEEMNIARVPPHQRLSVVFEDLEVCAKAFWQKERKVLLRGVSGQFRAGEVVAVMGPSGAGKTTLLNTISGFTTGMVTNGSVRIQREDGSVSTKRGAACYLTQDDHVQQLFTVREIVMQAADFKVGSRLSRKARELLVDDVIETLGLAESSCTRASQLSGGQRKRLSIAAELVDNPYILFFDEPTTGLDMSTAMQCTQLMRRIARSGRTVICTIHQPSENMLSMFDQVYILANGYCVYRGSPNDMLPFLNSLGYHCPKYHNPADFMLEVTNNEYGDAVSIMKEAHKNLPYPPLLPDIKENEANGRVNGKQGKAKETYINSEEYKPSEWERFRVLVTRNLLLQHRDWANTHTKLLAAFLVSLIIGILFGPIGDNAHRIMSNISIMFILSLYQCYTPEAPALLKYGDEVQIVKREWFNNWYRLYTYTIALLVSSLPLHVMISTILCSVAYYMTGQLAEPLRFAYITMALILISIASESLGLQIGSLFIKKKIVSLFIGATHLAYLLLFAGFLALKPEMPDWFDWGAKINHLHYGFNSILISSYKNRSRISCPEDVAYCHLRDPHAILNIFGLESSEIWHNYLALILFTAFLRITGFITLNYNVKHMNV
ncbi:hypothetical protein R5R35_011006 [Gryllus longicercus]|uniref:ABC transporter domain-containing protein n=1 Tax=Gryllus longicercus TaxID=2509291 RepID=A0AAN9Z092_9ORTH